MAYSIALANRVREYLAEIPHITVEEKAMFGGLAFLVNDKMCINIGENCRKAGLLASGNERQRTLWLLLCRAYGVQPKKRL